MYVCMYVRMYVRMYVCIYVYMWMLECLSVRPCQDHTSFSQTQTSAKNQRHGTGPPVSEYTLFLHVQKIHTYTSATMQTYTKL